MNLGLPTPFALLPRTVLVKLLNTDESDAVTQPAWGCAIRPCQCPSVPERPGRQPFGCLIHSKQLAHNDSMRIRLATGNVSLGILGVPLCPGNGYLQEVHIRNAARPILGGLGTLQRA